MGIKKSNGFTIIEVMLFLAITGALAVAILVGSGVSIGQQRYRDSVNSLQSFIQDQYSEVANVVNDRDQSWTCDSTAAVTQNSLGNGQPRGTSDCVILGRLITIDSTGTQLTATNVVGYPVPNAPIATSDLQEVQSDYTLGVSPINPETVSVDWGAQVVKPKTTTPMPMSMLIIRSPLSGSIIGFTSQGTQISLSNLVTAANMSQTQDLCVNADPGSFVGKRLEVQIEPYPTSQSAIQIPTESTSICD